MKSFSENLKIPTEANLVLIGGGPYSTTSRPMLELGLDLSGKSKPNVLIVPTPKSREQDYKALVTKGYSMYKDSIGTSVDILHGYKTMPSSSMLSDKIDEADVLYISGGNTKYAMQQWRETGIDKMLDTAMRKGKIMTGISAGALTWFNRGHSDSRSYEVDKGEPWDFMWVDGLGHIDTIATPHFNSTATPDGRLRSEHFKEMLFRLSQESGETESGLGIDNCAALLATGGLIRVLNTTSTAGLHVVRAYVGGSHSEQPLDAPNFTISGQNTSADQATNEAGITWGEFYEQLSKRVA